MKQVLALELIISLSAFLVGVLMIIFRRRGGTGYISTIAYAVCLSLGAIFLYIVSQFSNLQVVTVLRIITILIIGYLPAFILTYVLGYIIQSQRLYYRILFVLTLIPALSLVVIIVRSFPDLLLAGLQSQDLVAISPLDIWGWVMLVYSMGILVATLIMTFSTSGSHLKSLKTWPLFAINGAILTSIILDIISFSHLVPMISEYDLMLVGFTVIGVVLLIINLYTPQTNLITRDELFDNINDGIIILNNEDKILDLNPAAEKLIGIPTQLVHGNSVENILTNWNSISGPKETKEIEFRGSINLNRQRHYINVRVIKLDDGRGKVIVLRDMTGRKGTDDIRQRAREEMFNLLRSLFKSANTSQSTNDFFRDVLYQIAYTFHSESGTICLVDSLPDSKKFKFSLMAKHGNLLEDKVTISNLQEAWITSKWTLGNKEPLIISDERQDSLVVKIFQQLENHSFAVVPMVYNEKLMGVLMLAHTEPSGFDTDEIVRLGVVADELASFIYSDRKRKADIALSERHRLSQDLHDSITQKLYGLVTLTEAAKLGLESGAPLNENGMVEKIGENARQALREMRLFLFELEPMDIEKNGLISTLRQRLDSVEGRSGIQPRMIADNEILLSVEKETEIYYIVEEALNNILKHANAKSVVVKLKQRKASIYLEIVDNGCGFDPDNIEHGRKGLRNMKDRAKRIKGKLEITSSSRQGTKITLVVPQ